MALCSPCDKARYGDKSVRKYRASVSCVCARCGFSSEFPVQFDIDHVDGDHGNDSPENLETLCANCHRLKTLTRREFVRVGYRNKKTPH